MKTYKFYITNSEIKPFGYIKDLERFINISNDLFDKIDGYNHIDFPIKTFDDANDTMDTIITNINKINNFYTGKCNCKISINDIPKKYRNKENILECINSYIICKNFTPFNNEGKDKYIRIELDPEISRGNICARIKLSVYFYIEDNDKSSYFFPFILNNVELDKAIGMNYSDLVKICKKYNLEWGHTSIC